MKRLLTTLVLATTILLAYAQDAPHDHLRFEFRETSGRGSIISTNADPEQFDFKSLDKEGSDMWMKRALLKVQELEALGWEMQDFELGGPSGQTYIWMMRRPKR